MNLFWDKWRKRIGYGIGDLGCNLVFSTMASYLMIFYTDVFGITAAAAGTLTLVTKIIDAGTDTGMGLIVDRTHTRWGQGRPYFIVGAVPFAVFTVLTFVVPDFGATGKLVWAYVTYSLLCLSYTIVNIPLNTIVPRLTSDVHERDCLVSTRMVCAMIGTAVVMTITTPLVKFFGRGDNAKGYLITMSIYGVAAMLIFGITFLNTEEVVPTSVTHEHSRLKDDLKGLTGASIVLFILNFLYFGLYVIRNTSVLYYFTYNLGKTDWIVFVGLFGILSGLPMLLILPFLEKHISKRNLMVISSLIYAIGDLTIYLGKSSTVMLISGLAVTGLGIYGIFGTTFSMQPDVIDYSEYKNKKSIAGMIAAFQGFFVKASMGLASMLVGIFLTMSGYVPNIPQTPKALAAIETAFIWIPLIICVLICIAVYFYRVDSIRSEMSEELENRRRVNASKGSASASLQPSSN
ncbi:Isoprimeverose transporter [Caprobacter fermentans]|uniref:Isoprimeverose transporter n=1 Tax=Caproicibacter fermentans TaxID=2576756 RepID=A0A6N8HVR0_9FIRM|nr:MFS transporter [Caproicibacter fermentans]MVB09493.1 Isoprimeverose transporter [Caproicibacter fermentans]OCN02143.1 MelB protein [Clostridium sp. W14A]